MNEAFYQVCMSNKRISLKMEAVGFSETSVHMTTH